ncbi:transposable element Tcb1 transposase [Trichonephila clavipes]|uniref:Transposable element Tcb1 transposase n=1 Tax=Trichonephila clavipes TaxID=2585209 RepID=A0A8X6VTD8_TRICX|nr:transposable element Tcb1 transposase [Trichonephila clavipes]
MVWDVISFNSQLPLVIIRGTLTVQRCGDDILRTVLLPFLLQYLGLIFQKRPDHMRHVLLRAVLQLVKHFLGEPDLSSIEHVWYMMGKRPHLPGNVDDLAQ